MKDTSSMIVQKSVAHTFWERHKDCKKDISSLDYQAYEPKEWIRISSVMYHQQKSAGNPIQHDCVAYSRTDFHHPIYTPQTRQKGARPVAKFIWQLYRCVFASKAHKQLFPAVFTDLISQSQYALILRVRKPITVPPQRFSYHLHT